MWPSFSSNLIEGIIPVWRNLQMSLGNFGWDTVKIGVIKVKIQVSEWISKDMLIKNFFYMRGGRKFVVGEM